MRPALSLIVALLSSACDRNRWITPETAGSTDASVAAAPITSTQPVTAPDAVTLASAAPVAPSPLPAPIDSGVSIDVPERDVTVRVDATRDAVLLASSVDAEDEGVDARPEVAVATVLPVFVPVYVPMPVTVGVPSAVPVSPGVSTIAPTGSTGAGGSFATQPTPPPPPVAGGVLPFPAPTAPPSPTPAGGTLPPIAQPPTSAPSIAGGTSTIGAPLPMR